MNYNNILVLIFLAIMVTNAVIVYSVYLIESIKHIKSIDILYNKYDKNKQEYMDRFSKFWWIMISINILTFIYFFGSFKDNDIILIITFIFLISIFYKILGFIIYNTVQVNLYYQKETLIKYKLNIVYDGIHIDDKNRITFLTNDLTTNLIDANLSSNVLTYTKNNTLGLLCKPNTQLRADICTAQWFESRELSKSRKLLNILTLSIIKNYVLIKSAKRELFPYLTVANSHIPFSSIYEMTSNKSVAELSDDEINLLEMYFC